MAIRVGIGECRLGGLGDSLRATLGSCVGLCLADPKSLRFALVHVLLPTCPEASRTNRRQRSRYADTAVAYALELLDVDRRSRRSLRAFAAGGSQMYTGEQQRKSVGPQNQETLERAISEQRITVTGTDFGGATGRQLVVDGAGGTVFSMHLDDDSAPGPDKVTTAVQQWNLPAGFRSLEGWDRDGNHGR